MKKIVVGVEIDTSNAQQSIDALNAKLSELSENAEENADDIKKVSDALEELGDKGGASTKKASKGISGIGSSIKGLLSSLGIVTLVLKAFESLSAALQRNQKAADFLATAGIALEIVLDTIVQKGVIPLAEYMVKAFKEPQIFIDDLNTKIAEAKIEFEKFGDYIGSQFRETWLNLEKGILKARVQWNEFTGDSEEANLLRDKVTEITTEIEALNGSQKEYEDRVVNGFKNAVDAVTDFVNKTVDAAQAQAALDKAAKLAEANRALEQLQFQKRAEEQRQIRDDQFKSIEERKAASIELAKILDEEEKKEKAYVQAALDRAIAEEARNKGNIDLVLAVIEAKKQLADVEERITGQRSEQQSANRALLQEEIDAAEEAAAKKAELLAKEVEDRKKAEEDKAKALIETENLRKKQLAEQLAAIDRLADKIAGFIETSYTGDNGLVSAVTLLGATLTRSANDLYQVLEDENASFSDKIVAGLEVTKSAITGIQSLMNESTNQRISNIDAEESARIASLDAQLAAGTISEQAYQASVYKAKLKAYNEEEKLKKKAFESNKALGIVNAVISTAQAVISGFNAGASMGPAGVVMGPVMAALAAATGIAQIAMIASSKYTPGAAPGGGARPTAPAAPTLPSAGNMGPSVEFTGSGNNLNTVGGGANTQPQPIVVETNVSVSETEITSTQNNVSEYESSAALSG